MHTLSDNQIEEYMKEFELSRLQIIQMHEDFLGIPRQYIHLDSKTFSFVTFDSFLSLWEQTYQKHYTN